LGKYPVGQQALGELHRNSTLDESQVSRPGSQLGTRPTPETYEPPPQLCPYTSK